MHQLKPPQRPTFKRDKPAPKPPAVDYYRQSKVATLRYDYGQIEKDHGAAVRDAVQDAALEILAHGRRAKESIVAMGQQLINVKAMLPDGTFTAWLEKEFELSDRMARNFMNVAREYGDRTEIISVLNDTVLYLLAAPSTPAAARAEVEAIAITEGKSPKVARTQRVIKAHKPEPEPESDPDFPSMPDDLAEAGYRLVQKGRQWRWEVDKEWGVYVGNRLNNPADAILEARSDHAYRLAEIVAAEPPAPLTFDEWLAAMPEPTTLHDYHALLTLAKTIAVRALGDRPRLYNAVYGALPTWSVLLRELEKAAQP